jgi:ActR/RegA family two-component response regulator
MFNREDKVDLDHRRKQQYMVVTAGVSEKSRRTSIHWNTLTRLLKKFANMPR